MNRGQSVVFLLALTATAGLSFGAQVAELEVGQGKAAVVYPEHYLKDPGAGFPLVLLADVSQALPEIQTFADAYKEAVFVCAGTADRTLLLAELAKNPRLFAFPRGRIEIPSAELAAADAAAKLKTYFKWGRYQAETPALTRYGARIYRAERTDSADPTMTVSAPWKVIEGDPGETGCDARLAYFTVEADGENLPAPTVTVSWPGVKISSVDGARDVRMTDDGVMLTPTDSSGGTNYLTIVSEGAIELALHHHVEGAQHGPYGGRPLPWAKIRASDNWRAACRELFHLAGLADPKATDGASIKLYGFDSNFPNRHVDHPEHFHVMLEWDDWQKNNVGHYTLDENGFILGNNFLVCGDIAGGLTSGYHPQKPGEITAYIGPSGKPLFTLEMLEGGVGLVLRKPGSYVAWRMKSNRPSEFVELTVRENEGADWAGIGRVSVIDDTESGRYEIRRENAGSVATQVFRYERDIGALVGKADLADGRSEARQSVWYNSRRYRANLLLESGTLRFRDIHVMDDDDEEDWLRRACPDWRAEYRTPFVVDEKRLPSSGLVLSGVYDFTRPRLRDPLFKSAWIGDGEPDREEETFYDEDPASEFKTSFVLPEGAEETKVTVACAGYYALSLNARPSGVSSTSLMPLWSPFDRTVYADSFTARVSSGELLPHPATNVITVALGNGFYNLPPLLFWGAKCFRTALAHGRPCFKLQLSGVKGPLEWKRRTTNVIRNCVYLGAEVDATRSVDTVWRPAAHVPGPRGDIVPRTAPPVVYSGAVEAQTVRTLADGSIVIDFGANLSGVPVFEFKNEPRGSRIEIVYGERLNADGSVNVLTQTAGQIKRAGKGGKGAPALACQRDVYVCAGKSVERFEPPFVWHICRYAEVRGAKSVPKATLRTVSSELHPVAPGKGFRAADPKLQAIHDVCVRTFRDNLIGVQSDCPGRERLGYGGDIVATCEAMCLNFDMLEFYLKTLQDFADEAEGDGWITETAPFVGIADSDGLEAGGANRRGPVSWALAVPVLMETLLRHYPQARDRILAYYPVCARYVRKMAAKYPSGIVPKCIGDHEALERAPDEVTATAHYHEFVRLTSGLARAAGQEKDAGEFGALADRIKSAFRRAYVKGGIVANGTQSAQAIGLYLGLVDDVPAAEAQLLKSIAAKGFAPTTGIFSTRYMLMYLAEHGHNCVARRIVLHEGFPGWLHMLERGATTLWETWKESDDVYSNCHPMFGSVDEWILKYGGK
jgi:alpha-L-rhamnosidase